MIIALEQRNHSYDASMIYLKLRQSGMVVNHRLNRPLFARYFMATAIPEADVVGHGDNRLLWPTFSRPRWISGRMSAEAGSQHRYRQRLVYTGNPDMPALHENDRTA